VRPLTKRGADVVVWLLLLTMPYWINSVGGYTSLGSRVLVLALAAMSLNFLLGFTGVLSFGHAAYFGLGVYGMGLTIHARRHRYRGPRRRGLGCRDWAPDRALARDLFRDGHDRLRPSILFYRLPLEFGHRR
jgi:ABC-type branched-subunit amino acid transport system permease subunit